MPNPGDLPGDDGSKGRDGAAAPRRPKNFVVFLVVMTLCVLLLYMGSRLTPGGTEISIQDFLKLKEQNQISEVWVTGVSLKARMSGGGYLRDGTAYQEVHATLPPAFLTDHKGFEQLSQGVSPDKFHYSEPDVWPGFLLQFVPWVVLVAFAWWFFVRQLRSSGGPGNVLSFGRSHAKFVTHDKIRTTFDDVAGVDEAKEDVREIIEFLRDPQKFSRLGGRIPRGVLLVGSPGTGKTLLAKAIAGEARVPFMQITGSDFVEMFVGVGAARVRDLFNTAKEKSPCIIFIDEIDAVGRRRGTGLGGGHDEREQTLNQILVEMDGFDTDEGVIVIAATNRPDVLDPALMRPGRFDREVVIDLPDVKGREEILKVHAKKVKLGRDADLRRLARATPMFSGADLANLINEAAIMATMKRKDAVEMTDLEEARDKVMFGRQKKSREVIEEEKKLAGYHEAGHTIVNVMLSPHTDPVHKVTIIPRGRMGGATMFLPDRDRRSMSRQRAIARLAVSMGGRVSEEIFLGDVSSGAQDDFKQATTLARTMVCEWGMSDKMGPVSYAENEEHVFLGREIARTTNVSDPTQQNIDGEVQRLLNEAREQARGIISANRETVERIAQSLIRFETLSGEDVAKLIAGQPIEAEKERELEEGRRHDAKRASERAADPGWKPSSAMPGPQQA